MKTWPPTYALLALVTLAAPFTPAHAQCHFELTRPLAEAAHFSANCGGRKIEGVATNQLDAAPVCDPHRPPPCFEAPGVQVRVESPLPAEGETRPPSCFPVGQAREIIRLGFVNFGRSCFRTLAPSTRGEIDRWVKAPSPKGEACAIDEFGSSFQSSARDWANRFRASYPPAAARPANAAEAIYASFGIARDAAEGCLESLNPALASRVRQAMGVELRKDKGYVYRPEIECSEHEPYDCELPAEGCAKARAELEPAYLARSLDFGDSSARLKAHNCKPTPGGGGSGSLLADIDAAPLKPGQVVDGSPKIRVFETRGAESGGDRMASTLLHEFLHAAGAPEAADHNHGPSTAGRPLANDAVYACEAIAFKAGYSALKDAEVREACRLCADENRQKLCDGNLSKLGCRK